MKLLNRLGHSISNTQWEELDTAVCLAKKEDDLLPSNIIPGIPSDLVFDKIDRMEETISGSGTSHRVGIVVEPQVPTEKGPPREDSSNQPKTKKCTIQAQKFHIPAYYTPASQPM